jgi:hypothetical protein
MSIDIQGTAPDKLEVMIARVVDLVTKDVVPESPIDTLHITITTEFPVSSDVQSVVDLLEANSTPDTIIEVVEF